MLTIAADTDTLIIERGRRPPITIAVIDPERAAAILAERGITFAIAQMIAGGALGTHDSTMDIARLRGLVQ